MLFATSRWTRETGLARGSARIMTLILERTILPERVWRGLLEAPLDEHNVARQTWWTE
jgi:hypothetical protein